MTHQDLMSLALKARHNSYCPYSGFAVGADLLDASGRVWTGCNVENAAFGPSLCAERVAFFKAVSEGVTEFSAIAVCGAPAGLEPSAATPPCGVCRQVMAEFCDPDSFLILLEEDGRVVSHTLSQLLPLGFGPKHLGK